MATGVARRLSKLGLCSRSTAARWVESGRVRVNGRRVIDPEHPTTATDRLAVDDALVTAVERMVVMLNKPRGLVTTAADERGRPTVYQCLAGLPWLGPVGRLDQASEGLLLLTNDPGWAAQITDPEHGPIKCYHVQIDRLVDQALLVAINAGVIDRGERLSVVRCELLRSGTRSSWLQIELDEGRNRHLRRLLGALGVGVQRLVRVAIGPLVLGELAKGQWRELSVEEIVALIPPRSRLPVPA